MVNSEKFDEVFVGDECIKLPTPFKRDREWFREFMILNQRKSKTFDEDYEESIKKIAEDDTGAYLMIRNIGYLFNGMGDFNCNKKRNFLNFGIEKRLELKKGLRLLTAVWMYMI